MFRTKLKIKILGCTLAVQCCILLYNTVILSPYEDQRLELEIQDVKEHQKTQQNWIHPTQPTPASDVTIVTGYFNISNPKKRWHRHINVQSLYLKWKIFGRIRNPVIAFFEDPKHRKKFQALRVRQPSYMTRIEIVKKDSIWPFPLRPQIKKLFQQSLNMKHNPNAIANHYSALHAPYDLMAKALSINPFNTTFYAWLDIGVFQDIADYRPNRFDINTPPNFDQKKVAYAYSDELTNIIIDPYEIVKDHRVWIRGNFFIAKSEVMMRWVKRYKYNTEEMLNTGWIGGDEQVLYYMCQKRRVQNQTLEVQGYKADGRIYQLDHLAYLSSSLEPCEYNRTCRGYGLVHVQTRQPPIYKLPTGPYPKDLSVVIRSHDHRP